jgi:hypothetical protein
MRKTKTKPVEALNAEQALNKLNNTGARINELQLALLNPNYTKLVDFMMRFGVSKDAELIIQTLNRLQDQTQTFRRDSEFDTIYEVAMIDGERKLLKKFTELVLAAIESDRMKIENQLNRLI